MIPIRLIINNFRAIEHADIDLSAVSLPRSPAGTAPASHPLSLCHRDSPYLAT
ncbi:hypothetical protein [Cohnella cellulosilytica]|uniref:hypothetical protein n=1 Tax=Cohnella cellulosilytica TaxID=986710 RepID=UPI0036177E78